MKDRLRVLIDKANSKGTDIGHLIAELAQIVLDANGPEPEEPPDPKPPKPPAKNEKK